MNVEQALSEADLIKKVVLGKMSPHDKWNEVVRLREAAWQLKRASMRERHPDWTAEQIENSDSFSVWLAPAEYVILRKLEFYREGGSDKHAEDIRKMFLQGLGLNKPFLENEIAARGLGTLWAKCKS